MIAYAMADMKPAADDTTAAGSVAVSRDRGGCGASHTVKVSDEGRPYIDCHPCAAAQVASHYGWSATPHGVPQTPDQVAQRELAERDAQDHQNDILRAMTNAFVGQMDNFKAAQSAPQKTLQEQLAGMTDAERTALFQSFAAPAAPAPVKAPPRSPARGPRAH